MKPERIAGLIVSVVGVLLMVWGSYVVSTSDFKLATNIPTIVSSGFAMILYGVVVFILGVVISGFRNWIALGLHLAATLPYLLAIQAIIAQAQLLARLPADYFSASMIFWILGIALNVGGIVMNRMKPGRRKGLDGPAEAPPIPTATPPASPPPA